ncbi:MAG: hypothetical protein M1825_000123 [Sarcosagium campestre]|nr:MAG: hypothetical protein M1825_000123 [Sarcosagium campestre]
MSSETPNPATLKIESSDFNPAPGVELDSQQKLLAGSVLDLFAGKATLAKLGLWKDDGVFEDPITIARGRKEFEPQWYGLKAAFSEIERLSTQTVDAGNPIRIDMKTRYKIKGIGSNQTIASEVYIYYDKVSGKIEKVEDKWNGNLPDGAIKNVSAGKLLSPWWWLFYAEAWAFWSWSFVWYTRPWQMTAKLVQCTRNALVYICNQTTTTSTPSAPPSPHYLPLSPSVPIATANHQHHHKAIRKESARKFEPNQTFKQPNTHNDMPPPPPTAPWPTGLRRYTAAHYSASPTFNVWTKLTCADVKQRLHSREGYEGQSIYFLLNHPIRFVRLVGLIVARDDFEQSRVFLLDDGSGETVSLFLRDPEALRKSVTTGDQAQTHAQQEQEVIVESNPEKKKKKTLVKSEEQYSTTKVDIGTVVKVRGRLGRFRGEMQLEILRMSELLTSFSSTNSQTPFSFLHVTDMTDELRGKKIGILHTTTEEHHAWAETTAFRARILCKPWTVSAEDEARLLDRAQRRDEAAALRRWSREQKRLSCVEREWRRARRASLDRARSKVLSS